MKKTLLSLLALFVSVQIWAREFEYNGLLYTVIDENLKTCGTKQGIPYSTKPGNNVAGVLEIPAKVYDGDECFTVTEVLNYSFYGCELTELKFPSTLTSIGQYAFGYCDMLTSLSFPEGLTTIKLHAFCGCTGLDKLTFPTTLSYVGGFCGCTGLTSVFFSDSVTLIGSHAFQNCTGLTSVDIPPFVETIGVNAFSGCTGLTSIKIPDAVTNIDNYAFSNCVGLNSFSVPDAVTHLGRSVFQGCSGLQTVRLGKSLRRIGSDAFSGCINLHEIYSYNPEVPSIYASTFTAATENSANLYVPKGSLQTYSEADYWKKFVNIIEFETSSIEQSLVKCADSNLAVEFYDLNGRRVAEPSTGVYLRRQGTSVSKVLVK